MIRLNLAIFQRIYKTENEVKASVNVHGHAINSLTTSQDLTLRREREREDKWSSSNFYIF